MQSSFDAGAGNVRYLLKPATEEEITELGRGLEKTPSQSSHQVANEDRPTEPDVKHLRPEGFLPDDYRGFLRITNRFYSDDKNGYPDSSASIFYRIEGIDASDDVLWVHDLGFTLRPRELTDILDDDIPLREFTGSSVGAGAVKAKFCSYHHRL